VTRVTSLRKVGSITTAPLMISFMGVSPGADQSDTCCNCWRLCPDSSLCRVISYTIFILLLTCGALLASIVWSQHCLCPYQQYIFVFSRYRRRRCCDDFF